MPRSFDQLALAIHRALVGEMLPAFRAICLSVTDSAVTVTIFHDDAIDEGVAGELDVALAEVYADLADVGDAGLALRVGFDRRDALEPVPAIGVPIFALKGTQFLVQPDEV